MRDFDIRIILKTTLLKNYYEDTTSKVVEELDLPIGKARIDIAVINGHMHGYEIKSARDTLKRIPSQLEAYSKVFDYLSIVTEQRYEKKLLATTPEWVGIFTCEENGTVSLVRPALLNENRQSFYIAKLLWKEELQGLLTCKNIKFKKSDRNWLLCEALADHLPLEELASLVRSQLKQRSNWKA
jgi:hypothetical protein